MGDRAAKPGGAPCVASRNGGADSLLHNVSGGVCAPGPVNL